MRFGRGKQALILCALLLLPLAGAQGAIVQYQFKGVTESPDPGLAGVPDGTPFTGTLSYDTDQVDRSAAPDLGLYRFTSFSIKVGSGLITAHSPADPLEVWVENAGGPTGYSSDSLYTVASSNISGTVGSLASVTAFLVYFNDPTSAVFPNDKLPDASLSIADFRFANMDILGKIVVLPGFAVDASVRGTVTSLTAIPEPTTWTLMLAGLLSVGFGLGLKNQGRMPHRGR